MTEHRRSTTVGRRVRVGDERALLGDERALLGGRARSAEEASGRSDAGQPH